MKKHYEKFPFPGDLPKHHETLPNSINFNDVLEKHSNPYSCLSYFVIEIVRQFSKQLLFSIKYIIFCKARKNFVI